MASLRASAAAPQETVENDQSELDRIAEGPLVKKQECVSKFGIPPNQPPPIASQAAQAKAAARLKASAAEFKAQAMAAKLPRKETEPGAASSAMEIANRPKPVGKDC